MSASLRAGIAGANNSVTEMPAALSDSIAATRAWCDAARGSRRRFSVASKVVTLMAGRLFGNGKCTWVRSKFWSTGQRAATTPRKLFLHPP